MSIQDLLNQSPSADSLVTLVEQQLSSHPGHEMAWLYGYFLRQLKALEQADALDRAVLLRDIARLTGGQCSLPKELVSSDLYGLLEECGLRWLEDGNKILLQINSEMPGHFPSGLAKALELDSQTRRPIQPDIADGALLRLTHYSGYQNPSQKAAGRLLLSMPGGANALITMPTGAGKSLLFQLGVRWWQEQAMGDEIPVAVVIVPTISLALDHVESVKQVEGLEHSAAFHSGLSPSEKDHLLMGFEYGDIPLLFMAPESVLLGARETLLRMCQPRAERSLLAQATLAGIFIDEAHIIETWGRHFRPDFQRLPGYLNKLNSLNPELRTILLSATVRDSAESVLLQGFDSQRPSLRMASQVGRYEYDWIIHQAETHEERQNLLLELSPYLPRPAIIYTTEVAEAENLYAKLKEKGHQRLAVFTGNTPSDERKQIVADWKRDTLDLVIATSAFGMGVDKANVRAVVHACIPEDASRYYQEIGRGGRDGHQTLALCIWTWKDIKQARSMSYTSLSKENALERWPELRERAQFAERDGDFYLKVDINASPPRLGHEPGDYNRNWNRALLNQMQRFNLLEVLESDEDSNYWHIKLKQASLLETSEALESAFTIREQEKEQAYASIDRLVEVLKGKYEQCLLSEIFELVESGSPLIEPCGRCVRCIEDRTEPPTKLGYKGFMATWKETQIKSMSRLRGGLSLWHAESMDDVEALNQQLVKLGFSQFIVPQGMGQRWSQILAKPEYSGNPGLVLESQHVYPLAWKLLPLPTCLIVSSEVENRVLDRAVNQFSLSSRTPLMIVSSPNYIYKERPIGQSLGKMAPLTHENIQSMLAGVP
ncbi:MAG: helicase-related protein [Candidatus Sericytochromatia bacterium]